jgi:hypothetical protein
MIMYNIYKTVTDGFHYWIDKTITLTDSEETAFLVVSKLNEMYNYPNDEGEEFGFDYIEPLVTKKTMDDIIEIANQIKNEVGI